MPENTERTDTLPHSGYKIIQNPQKFCYGIDAVLLADYAKASLKAGSEVFDLGTGTGIIPLLLHAEYPEAHFTALEIQPESADMAKRSMELNSLETSINVLEKDIKSVPDEFPKACANLVTSNPPYMPNLHGKQNPDDCKAIARHEVLCTLEDVIKAASHLLKPTGSFVMIHRPLRLSEIFILLSKYGLEPKTMRLVQPHQNEAPNMVLIKAVKGANPELKIDAPLIVREQNGEYTAQVKEIYGITD